MGGLQTFFQGVMIVQYIVVPLVITFAAGIYAWGVFRYVFALKHEGEQEKGKKLMLWGVAIIAIATIIWAVLSWLAGVSGAEPPIPSDEVYTEDGVIVPGVETSTEVIVQ